MTASIPSSFNPEDLQRMLEAKAEEESSKSSTELAQEQIEYIAEKALSEAGEEGGTSAPVVHKVMMLMICHKFVQWHTNCSEKLHSEGEAESGTCWARDAGKFQAMMDILLSISVGPDDYTFTAE